MSASTAANLAPTILVLVVIVLLLARRTYAMIQGAAYSSGRVFAYGGFYVFLFALLAASTLYAAYSLWGSVAFVLVAPYVATVVVVGLLATPYVRREVKFEQRGDGLWYYKLPWHVPVLVLALFIVRLGTELAIFGASAVTSFTLPASLPSSLIFVLIAIDLLFAVSVGLLLGRGLGVYRAHQDLLATQAGGAAPLASGNRPS